jgi:MFS family permease
MGELLRDSTYIRYWLAVVVSFLGDAMTRVTLIYLAATVTGAPVVFIALVIIAQLLPSGLLGTFVGPLADQVPKRVLLVGADLVRVAIVLAMIVARDSAPALLALILLEGIGKAFFETARMAAIPAIVAGKSIPSAVALFQSTVNTINLVGPALGGLLVALGSVPVVLVIDAGTFVLSAALLASLAVLRTVPAARREPYWTALRTGVRAVLAVGSLRRLAMVAMPVMLALGLFTTNVNAQLLTVFHLNAIDYGLAQAMVGGGAIIGALLGPALLRRLSAQNLLVAAVGLFGGSLVAVAPVEWLRDATGLVLILLWCAGSGLGSGLVQVPIANTLLRDLPPEVRGRGVGLLNALMVNFMVVGVAVGGVLAGLSGVVNSIIIAGGALIVTAGTVACTARSAPGAAPADTTIPAETAGSGGTVIRDAPGELRRGRSPRRRRLPRPEVVDER